VCIGVDVQRLTPAGDGFIVETSAWSMVALQVVVATGPFHRRHVPATAADLSPEVFQLHSYDYRSPADVPPGDVLVVGGGNSAAQLAVKLSDTHRVTVAAPRDPWYLPVSLLGVDLYRWSYLTGLVNAERDSGPRATCAGAATPSSAAGCASSREAAGSASSRTASSAPRATPCISRTAAR